MTCSCLRSQKEMVGDVGFSGGREVAARLGLWHSLLWNLREFFGDHLWFVRLSFGVANYVPINVFY